MRRIRFLVPCVLTAAALLIPTTPLTAQTEGDYLYNVTMLRAAPGMWSDLSEMLQEHEALHQLAGDPTPFRMRHSQGDQWDFMLIVPMDSWGAYYSPERVEQRASVWQSPRGQAFLERMESLVAYREEWFARSAPLDEMVRRFFGMGMFHVEMFAGLAGNRDALVEQRRMENRYYAHLSRQLNMIFVRDSGSNWDAMTIGFYPDLQAYAAAGVRYSEAEQDEAARIAGFSGVDAISPYLRALLSYHRDTIAVRMR